MSQFEKRAVTPTDVVLWFFEDSFFSITLRPSTRWVGRGQVDKQSRQ